MASTASTLKSMADNMSIFTAYNFIKKITNLELVIQQLYVYSYQLCM
jgi:hypothetical protein